MTENRPTPKPAPGPTAKWIRPADVCQIYGIRREALYPLARRGEIQMVSLRAPGARRGMALVSVESIERMISRHAAAREPGEVAKEETLR